MKLTSFILALSLLPVPAMAGWFDQTSDQKSAQQQEQLVAQSNTLLGMPAITNFTEKRMLKMLYELRDRSDLVTYAYYLDLNGGRHKVCPKNAIGYGIPYATQYSSPQRVAKWAELPEHGNLVLPQPEPNGLFMPSAADGTWVMCLAPDGKSIKPVYVEPRVLVYPFEMPSVD